MKSTHPYEPFIPLNAEKLIIGTIPPIRFCIKEREIFDDDVNFYYGSRDNAFWPIIENIFFKYFRPSVIISQTCKVYELIRLIRKIRRFNF